MRRRSNAEILAASDALNEGLDDVAVRMPTERHFPVGELGLVPLELSPVGWDAIISVAEGFGDSHDTLLQASIATLKRQLEKVAKWYADEPVGLRFVIIGMKPAE